MLILPRFIVVAFVTLGGLGVAGCDKKPPANAPPSPTGSAGAGAATGGTSHHGEGHGAVVPLGEKTVGGFAFKASHDGGITPGSDVPIDVWVTPAAGTAVASVRFWIGSEDAKGSVKAKAELEKDNWHTHAEVPKPLPEGSKLWIEVETESGAKVIAGFDLKA